MMIGSTVKYIGTPRGQIRLGDRGTIIDFISELDFILVDWHIKRKNTQCAVDSCDIIEVT